MKPEGSMHQVGKYLALAFALPASMFAGYWLGAAAERWLHISFLPAAGILLGAASGIWQIFREVSRETNGGK